MSNTNTNGQSLFETLIALALIAVVTVTLLSVSTKSLNTSTESKNRSLAKIYAQEVHEWIRNEREYDYNTLWQLAGDESTASRKIYCVSTIPNDFSGLVEGDCGATEYIAGTQFKRVLELGKTSSSPHYEKYVRTYVLLQWDKAGEEIYFESDNIIADPRIF